MFKKILFPTSFGEFSREILQSIVCLKAAGLEEVVLLHVIDTDSLYSEIDGAVVLNLDLIKKEANKRLDSYATYLSDEGLASKPLVANGRLLSEIMRVTTEESVSLIVAGREKRGILGELFVGSTTHGIIRKSTVPVLVAKHHTIREIGGQVQERFCTDMFRKILYPTDWSACAERAKEYLRPFRQVGASEVIVAHVTDDGLTEVEFVTEGIREQWKAESEERLKNLEKELAQWGFRVRTFLIRNGQPYQNIVELASDVDASLIVMGSHGRGFVAQTIWGSVSQRVAEHSEKPVLVVK